MKDKKASRFGEMLHSCKTFLVGICAVALLISLSGCADKGDVEKAEALAAQMEQGDDGLSANKSDILYMAHVLRTKSDYLARRMYENRKPVEYVNGEVVDELAFEKREGALGLARGFFTYKFYNYCHMDGISALIYNLAYLVSVPNKLLRGIRCSDGVWGYLCDVCKLIFGAIAALIGLVLATIAGFIFHPWQSLANLTIGLFYSGDNWWSYVCNTNLLASLWDVVWGSIIYPLWQTVTFWL